MSNPPHPAAAAAAAQPWHLAGALVALKRAVDSHWPKRDKRSDGGIGDERHRDRGNRVRPQSVAEQHRPGLRLRRRRHRLACGSRSSSDWPAGAGTAGSPGSTGDTSDNGYVIHRGLITAPDFSRWLPYDGRNRHAGIVHVSVTRDPGGYEDAGPWAFIERPVPAVPAAAGGPAAAGAGAPRRRSPGNAAPAGAAPRTTTRCARSPATPRPGTTPPAPAPASARSSATAAPASAGCRRSSIGCSRSTPRWCVDGDYGPNTAAVVEEFARRSACDPNTPADDRDGLADADGNNVGPRIARALDRYGIDL